MTDKNVRLEYCRALLIGVGFTLLGIGLILGIVLLTQLSEYYEPFLITSISAIVLGLVALIGSKFIKTGDEKYER